MKNPALCLLITLPWLALNNNWILARVDKIVSVSFPAKPEKEKAAKSIVFTSDNDNCLFMVTAAELIPAGVMLDDITSEQEDKFLDGVLSGSLKAYQGKEETERKTFNVGNILGKEMSFSDH